jgi:hypothetical protein
MFFVLFLCCCTGMLYCSGLKERRVDVEENRKMRNDGKLKMWKEETGIRKQERKKIKF